MMMTTWEASEKYGMSMNHLRLLMSKGTIQGRQANLTPTRVIWLIEEKSLQAYLKTDRRPGRKSTKKKD